MTSENFDNLCDQIYSQLHNKLERNHDPYFQFATNGTAERVLHHDNLTRLFLCLPAAGHTVVQQFGLTEEELAARVDERQLHSFLAVLIYGCCGIEAARIFTRKLVATNEWPLLGNTSGKRIELLPASRLDLLDIFRDTVIVTKFCGSQACFSTVTILKRQEISIESLASQRLPYLEEHEIGSGDFGRVFRVKIAKGHFKDARRGTLNETPMDVARKDYITTNEFGDEERKTIEKIFNGSNRKCANILGNYGSIRIGVSAYSLFMPCAICDLRAYMTIHHPKGPNTTLEKAEMILSAQGIAEGLDFLHNEMKTADQEDMVCYHMDLKPSNILVFLDTAYDGGTRYVWKLSDFGMARVKIRKRGQTVEQNFNKSFLHRSQPEPEQSVSRTVNRRGQGTYLPPESLKKTPTMTTSSDVWALGCVLSVVFAYLEDGIEGVNDYQTKRLHHPESEGYDRFFLRGHHFRSSKEHPEVHKWHHYLIKKAAHRQAEEEHAVKYMLAYLEEKVLVIDDKKRDNVKIVKRRLAETYSLFKKMAPVEGSTTADGNDHPRWIDRILPIRPRNAPHSNSQVESWQLSEVEGLKGCEISPKGTLVAYWSDIKIKLYNELSLSRKEPPTIDPYAEYTLELADCIWKSVALSEKYLIASTTGANFQCYIYDVVLNRQYHIILQRPEIITLAISADSKTLACVMQSKEEGQECGSVFLVSILDLIRGVSPCQSDSTTLPLDWPATYITHISFPTPDEVYLVVQPQITARSRENEISMVRLSLKTRQMQTVRIQSQGVDPGNTVGLFTAFTTFRQQPATWAFITRQKQLHIQDLSKPRNNDIANPIRNYRVLKLVMDSNDKKIFALGTHSGNNRVHLLEMTVPQSENDKVCVKELLSLPDLSYDDEFTQVLSYSPHASGEKYILIAALTTASPRWIYRIPLPDSSTVS